MKIIQTGSWGKKITCKGCKSILEATVDDIQHEQVQQEDESFAVQFFIECPVCSRKNIQRDIPPKISEQVLA